MVLVVSKIQIRDIQIREIREIQNFHIMISVIKFLIPEIQLEMSEIRIWSVRNST